MPDLKKIKAKGSSDLTKEVADLKWAVMHSTELFQRQYQMKRILGVAFLRGIVSAFGALAMIVIILPIVIWTLRSVAWLPLIGDIVIAVTDQLEQSNHPLPSTADDQ
jgi:hypothetical protein